MSEYQYYEFLAVDRLLDAADQQALRDISSRARITATSFVNSYQWGDLKGDPVQLMARWFDLHFYMANWGTRELMIRLPAALVDRARLESLLPDREFAEPFAELRDAGEHLILDIQVNDLEVEHDDEGSGWLAALAPLRADLLAGDLRLFYLLWLASIGTADAAEEAEDEKDEEQKEDAPEPLPGLGPLTPALETFARFLAIDPDLVQVAAERAAEPGVSDLPPAALRDAVATLPAAVTTALLHRLIESPPRAAAELRAELRRRLVPAARPAAEPPRRAGELLARAAAIRLAREQAAAEWQAAARAKAAKEAEAARRSRLAALARKGEAVWQEIETEIERRNAAGYDRALDLLCDLQALAERDGTQPAFATRLAAIRERHARKPRFIERLTVFE